MSPDTAVSAGQAYGPLTAAAKAVDSRGWRAGSPSLKSPWGCWPVLQTRWLSASRTGHQTAAGRRSVASNPAAWKARNVFSAPCLSSQWSAPSGVGRDSTCTSTLGDKVAGRPFADPGSGGNMAHTTPWLVVFKSFLYLFFNRNSSIRLHFMYTSEWSHPSSGQMAWLAHCPKPRPLSRPPSSDPSPPPEGRTAGPRV